MMRKISKPKSQNFENLFLNNQLCFALYAATNSVTRAYREPLAKVGLTYPQYLAMLVLWEQGAQTVKGLANALQLDSSTLTPLLKRLESAGWLTRTRDQADERIVRIELSAAGKSLRRPVADIQKTIACQTHLSESELSDLRERLHSLTLSMSHAELAEAAV